MYTKRPWLKIVEIFVVSLLVLTGLRMIVLKQSGSTKSSDTGNTQETVTAAESGIGADTILPKVSKIEIGDQSGGTQRHEISKEAAPVDLSERMSEDSTPVCNISASLSDILASAAFPDKTVIVTAFTKPFSPMLDIFVERLLKSRTTKSSWPHVVVINFDEPGFHYCCQQHLHCYFDSQEGVAEKVAYGAEEQKWMVPNYLRMMWRRLELLRLIVRSGYHVLFTDVDIAWLQDPLEELKSSDADIQFASDVYHAEDKAKTLINCGFFYARSNPATLQFFDYWFDDHETRHPGQNEQDVMQIIRPELDTFTISLGVNIRYLPTVMYSSFCEMPKELDQLKTIHPNCCPQGLDAKLRVLRRSLEDYDWIMSLPVSFSKQLGSHDFQWIKPQC